MTGITRDILTVPHPVPMRYRLANGREVIAFRLHRTPVRLTMLDAGAMTDIADVPKGAQDYVMGTLRTDGTRTWVQAGRTTAYDWENLVPVTLEDITSAFASRVGLTRWPNFECDWLSRKNGILSAWAYRAPLGPRKATGIVNSSYLTDGHDSVMTTSQVEHLGPKAFMVEDHGPQAEAALVRLFDEEVRIVDGKVHLLFQGVHSVCLPSLRRKHRALRFNLTTTPWHSQRGSRDCFLLPMDPSVLPKGFAYEDAEEHTVDEKAERTFLASLPAPDGWRQAVSMHAHDLPLRAVYWANGRSRRDPDVDLSPLMRLAALGTIGAIPPWEEDDAFRTLANLARAAWGSNPRGIADEIIAYAETVALMLLGAQDERITDPADLAALADIA